MLRSLWSFIRRNPQSLIPFPWERRYDARSEIVYYKNAIDESVVVDLRSRITVGNGLYHTNNWWHFLTGRRNQEEEEEEAAAAAACLVRATCCGPLFYLILPERLHFCPLCYAFLFYFP